MKAALIRLVRLRKYATLSIVGAALLLSACAQPQPHPRRTTLPERSVDEAAALLQLTSNELDMFVLEPRGSCESVALYTALGAAASFAELYLAAGAIREPIALAPLYGVALAAEGRGCPDFAMMVNHRADSMGGY